MDNKFPTPQSGGRRNKFAVAAASVDFEIARRAQLHLGAAPAALSTARTARRAPDKSARKKSSLPGLSKYGGIRENSGSFYGGLLVDSL